MGHRASDVRDRSRDRNPGFLGGKYLIVSLLGSSPGLPTVRDVCSSKDRISFWSDPYRRESLDTSSVRPSDPATVYEVLLARAGLFTLVLFLQWPFGVTLDSSLPPCFHRSSPRSVALSPCTPLLCGRRVCLSRPVITPPHTTNGSDLYGFTLKEERIK